jgi:predicted transcriptional regulator of viral defense system
VGCLTEPVVPENNPPLDVAIAELAEGQWGVVSVAQMEALGLGARAVCKRVSAGRLRRVHRGVYAVGHGVLRPEGRRLAAVLACGAGAVLSHRSAASHWGLLPSQAALIDVEGVRPSVCEAEAT